MKGPSIPTMSPSVSPCRGCSMRVCSPMRQMRCMLCSVRTLKRTCWCCDDWCDEHCHLNLSSRFCKAYNKTSITENETMCARMTTRSTTKAETPSTKEEEGQSAFIALKVKQQVYPWTPTAFHNNVTGWCNLSFQDQTVHSIGQGVMFCWSS